MSSFNYRALPSWQDDREGAGLISATPEADANVLATYCCLDDTGKDVIYQQDIPLVVRRGVPLQMEGATFYAMMAEPRDAALSSFLAGKDLVMATWPVSRGWYDRGQFQFGAKHKTRALGKEVEAAFRQQPGAMRDLLQKLGKNPFDSRHRITTAVLCDPYPLDKLKKFILGRQTYPGARQREPRHLMAICEDFLLLREKLLMDSLLLDMITATYESKDLFLRYHRHLLHIISAQAGSGMGEPGSDAAKYKIFDEIADASLAQEIMSAAIDFALAGPEDYAAFRSSLDGDGEPDGRKLAKHRARDIYLELYWNLWRRTATARRTSPKRPARSIPTPPPDPASREKVFWQAVDEHTQDLDLTPFGIEATAKKTIEEFEDNEGQGGLPYGPVHQDSQLGARQAFNDEGEIFWFLLQAAAILRAGCYPRRLRLLLEDLREDGDEQVRSMIDWAAAMHAQNRRSKT